MRDEIALAHAGHPQESREALDEFDESLESAVLSLNDPAREAAWSQLG